MAASPILPLFGAMNFEDINTPVESNYYEFDNDMGDFARINTEAASGQYSLRARWQTGEVDAGHFMRNFGRNPIGSQSHQSQNFREIYWRHYLKLQDGFTGHSDKVSRVTIFAGANWQQDMIAHIWASSRQREFLIMDPASGIDSNSTFVTTQWNDFDHLIWLGSHKEQHLQFLVSGTA